MSTRSHGHHAERRQSRRAEKPFMAAVRYSPKGFEPVHDLVTVQNLSVGGALFNYAREIERGTPLDLRIAGKAGDAIHVSGKVHRIAPAERGHLFRIVVAFTDTTEAHRELVRQVTGHIPPPESRE